MKTLVAPVLDGVRQQARWDDPDEAAAVRAALTQRPALVDADDVRALRAALAGVAAGAALVVQAGDCAEDPAECTAPHVRRKAHLLTVLARRLAFTTRRPVVQIGRIAGQYCKPRSRPTETVGGVELPTFRGHLINGPEPDPVSRRPDPWRLLTGYHAASNVLRHLDEWATRSRTPTWVSHEALLLDYEIPQVRYGPHGMVLGSTHMPWIGDRTRQPAGPHVDLLAAVVNPVACKVGPTITADELLELCERLDPQRVPGRLTLISRMGAPLVEELLPPLVAAVRAAQHPVIWLCDPMHGNTVTTSRGFKTRPMEALLCEVRVFQQVVRDAGGVDGGLHLECTPDPVMECLSPGVDERRIGAQRYTTLCDPRLNPAQAVAVAAAWAG